MPKKSLKDIFQKSKVEDTLKVLEKTVEKYLCDEIKKIGGWPYKFRSMNYASVPDRLCMFHGFVVFVECKRPGNVPTKNQALELAKISSYGHMAFVVDSKEAVDRLIEIIKRRLEDGHINEPERSEN